MPTDLRIRFKRRRRVREALDQKFGYDSRQGVPKKQLFQRAKSILTEVVVQTVEKTIRLRNCPLDFFYRKPIGKNGMSVHIALIQGSRQLHFLFPSVTSSYRAGLCSRLPRILVDQVFERDFLVRRFARLFGGIAEGDESDRTDVGGQLQYLGDFFRIVRANKAGPEPALGRA